MQGLEEGSRNRKPELCVVLIPPVVHNRKEADGNALSLNSVFGSAKATQEADNVVMVQIGKKVSGVCQATNPRCRACEV